MLAADGKMRNTDVADTEQFLRLVQSIPLKKAEPFSPSFPEKTGENYVKHKLVISVHTTKGPRQKVVMPLGVLTVPRIDRKQLAHVRNGYYAG